MFRFFPLLILVFLTSCSVAPVGDDKDKKNDISPGDRAVLNGIEDSPSCGTKCKARVKEEERGFSNHDGDRKNGISPSDRALLDRIEDSPSCGIKCEQRVWEEKRGFNKNKHNGWRL